MLDLSDILEESNTTKDFLFQEMGNYIIDQESAKKALIDTLINWLYQVNREQGVLGAVFLGGPTGVGKTELVRTLARILLGDPNAFLKISWETLTGSHLVENLTGSSKGYVGYGDEPWMADTRVHAWYKNAKKQNKLHPLLSRYNAHNFSIVLVDEVEKAHRDIPNIFLGAIQSWRMEMTSWKWVTGGKDIEHSQFTDLSNTLLVFTSNIGEHAIKNAKGSSIGFTSQTEKDTKWDESSFHQALSQHFAPEFLGRMDSIVRCHALTSEHIQSIFKNSVHRMNSIIQKDRWFPHLHVEITSEFIEQSLKWAEVENYGARSIDKVMKSLWSQVGIILDSGRINQEAKWQILFGMDWEKQTIQFLEGNIISPSSRKSLAPEVWVKKWKNILHQSKFLQDLVSNKTLKYKKDMEKALQLYMGFLSDYDPGFEYFLKISENRLRGYGINTKQIEDINSFTFTQLDESSEKLDIFQVTEKGENMFWKIKKKEIESYLFAAVKKQHPTSHMYTNIVNVLRRPLTKDEATFISQYIHKVVSTLHAL